MEGLRGIRAGDELVVLTWLDRARRDVLRGHPRADEARPGHGVFATRSPDGTPILDVKPVLTGIGER